MPAGDRTRDLACFLFLFLATLVTAQTDTELLEGVLSLLTSHVPPGLDGDAFYLELQNRTGNGTYLSQLQFKSKPEDLVSGDKLQVKVRKPQGMMRAFAVQPMGLQPSDNTEILEVDSYSVTVPNPNKDFNFNFGTVNITSITFLTTVCGQRSVSDVEFFKSRWLNQFNPNAGREFGTLENYYKECSYGKARFTGGTDNIIVDMTDHDLGCFGFWQLQPWFANRCGTAEIFGWLEAAKQYAYNVLGIDYTKFSRWILIMPDNNCPWSGLASVGCGRNCASWIKGSYAVNQFATAFHELGHNLGLQHATTPGAEYGDGSSTMGGCCGDRCFNAPNSWQVNWAKPVAVLNATTLPLGTWRSFTVPALTLNPFNHVQLVPTWNIGATTPAYFFSYRQPKGWDSTILPQYAAGLSVHIFNGTQTVGALKSELQGVMDVNTSMDITALNFILQFVSRSERSATFKICRYSSKTETSCTDRLDNDCDGLIDAADPDCIGRIPPPPPPACNNNGICERPRENHILCPSDCPPLCGDGRCVPGESARTCPRDCPPVCGDCYCDILRGEKAFTCPHDCPPVCGDGYCEYNRGENARNCPTTGGLFPGDCPVKCGDHFCDSTRGESNLNCPQDCPPVCGDGSCSRGENSMNCRQDCPLRCGDRFCDVSAGEPTTCRRDCPLGQTPAAIAMDTSPPTLNTTADTATTPPSPNTTSGALPPRPRVCVPLPHGSTLVGSTIVAHSAYLMDDSEVEDEVTQAAVCGDDRCNGQETAITCPRDCPAVCGDDYCDKYRGEDALTCAKDCPIEWCGDGVCGVSERVETCAADCCPASRCGDGVCQAYGGENCLTCPKDCAGSKEEGYCCGAFLSCASTGCNSEGSRCVQGCSGIE